MIKNTRVDKFSTFSTTWKIYLMRQLINYFLLNSTIYETYCLFFWNQNVQSNTKGQTLYFHKMVTQNTLRTHKGN